MTAVQKQIAPPHTFISRRKSFISIFYFYWWEWMSFRTSLAIYIISSMCLIIHFTIFKFDSLFFINCTSSLSIMYVIYLSVIYISKIFFQCVVLTTYAFALLNCCAVESVCLFLCKIPDFTLYLEMPFLPQDSKCIH